MVRSSCSARVAQVMRANRAAVARATGVGGMEIYIVNPGIAGDEEADYRSLLRLDTGRGGPFYLGK